METIEILANCCHVCTLILHFLFYENMFWEQRMMLWLKLIWLHGWTLNFCRMKFSKFRYEWIWVLCIKANNMIIGTHWHQLPLRSQVSCLHCNALQWYCVILGTQWQWLSLWSLKVLCLYKSALQWLFVICSLPSFPLSVVCLYDMRISGLWRLTSWSCGYDTLWSDG